MVTILTRIDDLEQLVGRKLPRNHEQLNEILYSVKCELSGISRTEPILEDSELQLENKDTNRPDTWSTEGIARPHGIARNRSRPQNLHAYRKTSRPNQS